MQPWQSNQRDVLTQIMLTVFRVNGHLLKKGDELVAPIGMTSSRFQVLGSIALCDQAPTCSQIVAKMGITRQGAQKQLNKALKEGLIVSLPNPRHERAPLYALTKSGRDTFEKAVKRHEVWADTLAQHITLKDLQTTFDVLSDLDTLLQSTPISV